MAHKHGGGGTPAATDAFGQLQNVNLSECRADDAAKATEAAKWQQIFSVT